MYKFDMTCFFSKILIFITLKIGVYFYGICVFIIHRLKNSLNNSSIFRYDKRLGIEATSRPDPFRSIHLAHSFESEALRTINSSQSVQLDRLQFSRSKEQTRKHHVRVLCSLFTFVVRPAFRRILARDNSAKFWNTSKSDCRLLIVLRLQNLYEV